MSWLLEKTKNEIREVEQRGQGGEKWEDNEKKKNEKEGESACLHCL